MAVGDLITLPFQYEFNGLLMGSGTDFITTKVEGLLGTPDIKTTDFDRMDAWGEYPGRDMYKGRKVTFTVDVKGLPSLDGINPIQDNYDRLTAALAVPDVSPPAQALELVYLRPWSAPAGKRYLFCRPGRQGIVSDSDFGIGHFQAVFELKANDPRIYSLTQYLSPLTILNTTSQITGTITNQGNSASAPLIVVNGPATNPLIANTNDNNKTFAITITLGALDSLTIDMRQRTIMLNGVTDVSGLLGVGADFWKLQKGPNLITYSRSDSGASSTMNIYHNDVWSS